MSYAWDDEGRLTSAGGTTYTYDGDGKRVKKGSSTFYWYGMSAVPLAETGVNGSTTNEYVFFAGGRTARRDSAGNVYYYFGDHLGSSRSVTNVTGGICYEADFYPFGGERVITNTCSQNYKFAGMERDSETGNDHTWFRSYASNLGRWLSPDPLAGSVFNPQSLNRYSYVLNNPTTLIDPLGLQGQDEHGPPWPAGAPSWWTEAVQYCREHGLGGCLRSLYTAGWTGGGWTGLSTCQWDGVSMDCSAVSGPQTEPIVLFDPGQISSEGDIVRAPGIAILPEDFSWWGTLTSTANNGSQAIAAKNTKQTIGTPKTSSQCSIYLQGGSASGKVLNFLCGQFPDDPWSQRMRGCLQALYDPNSGYLPVPVLVPTTPASVFDLNSAIPGTGAHAVCALDASGFH